MLHLQYDIGRIRIVNNKRTHVPSIADLLLTFPSRYNLPAIHRAMQDDKTEKVT